MHFEWHKRLLLAYLDTFPGYKGLIIFSKQLDEMGDEVWDLKRFIEYTKKVLRAAYSINV